MSVVALRAPSAHTLLRLGRVSNLPTVWTNVIAGATIANTAATLVDVAVVGLAMTAFYAGGMYLNDVCCGVSYCGPGDDIGPHGWQIRYPAQPQQSLGTGCSHGDNTHPTSSCWQNAISRAMSADFEPVRSLSGRTSHV